MRVKHNSMSVINSLKVKQFLGGWEGAGLGGAGRHDWE